MREAVLWQLLCGHVRCACVAYPHAQRCLQRRLSDAEMQDSVVPVASWMWVEKSPPLQADPPAQETYAKIACRPASAWSCDVGPHARSKSGTATMQSSHGSQAVSQQTIASWLLCDEARPPLCTAVFSCMRGSHQRRRCTVKPAGLSAPQRPCGACRDLLTFQQADTAACALT